jgi:pimeloyl-ACP methyl ester carboxylesterase
MSNLVAHDWGGAVAYSYADEHPEAVNKINYSSFYHNSFYFQLCRIQNQVSFNALTQ